ncbi:MAG: hypothetical protein H6999_10970 [Hahellaceae bacterium]|nr:hypothetical protein [Hahellaceae bacterium]
MNPAREPESEHYWKRMKTFMDVIYEPKLHFAFAAFWFLSLQGLMLAIAGHSDGVDKIAWTWTPATLTGVLTLFLIMFYLRAVDEVKDYEYDRKYNPDRPLVNGAVSFNDLRSYWVLGLLIVPLLNSWISPWLVLFVLLDMGYGLLLIKMEQWIPWMERSLFFNLLLTYPVSIALSFYTLILTAISYPIDVTPRLFALIGVYILAFLHFEIVRKNLWPDMADPGEKFYSHDIGAIPAAILGYGCGLAAVVWVICLTEPWYQSGWAAVTGWLPILAMYSAQRSLSTFLKERQNRYNPRRWAVLFLVPFYVTNLIHAWVVTA